MMFLLLFTSALAVALLVGAQEAPAKLPNVDFTGVALRVCRKPRSHVYGNVWRGSVVSVNYSRKEKSSVGRWLMPGSAPQLGCVKQQGLRAYAAACGRWAAATMRNRSKCSISAAARRSWFRKVSDITKVRVRRVLCRLLSVERP